MSSRSSSSGSAVRNSKQKEVEGKSPSREFQAVSTLFPSRASLIPPDEHPALIKRFEQLYGGLSRDQQEVVALRFNLKGREPAPVSDHREIAAKLGRGPQQVNWSLASAERTLRENLAKSFPVLQTPRRTPQNS